MSTASPLPSRASLPDYSNFELDDAQADFATAFALRDQLGLAGLVKSITPRDDYAFSEYSSSFKDAFDVPINEWETVFLNEHIRYKSFSKALKAL
jgi:hypothetical protein